MAKAPPLNPPPPPFSKRVYFGAVYPSSHSIGMPENEPLIIYVEAMRSSYPEDWRTEEFSWRNNRAFMSRCYSVIEPEGEIGFTPLSEVTAISEEEFRGAISALKSGGWPGRVE